jgi:WD40 repeat protein/serine/threonine protein kinase
LVGGARQEFCPKCLYLQAGAGLLDPASNPDGSPLAKDSSSQVAPPSSRLLHSESHSSLITDHSSLPQSFGDYELIEEIGRGGMGVVYRARQRSLDRVVALKMMAFAPDSSPELVKRFRAEAVSAASLHHPNIVAIHEVGIHEDRHFFVMDYVEGQSLARLVGNQPLPVKRAAAHLKTTAEAVHYAHERGILHRDLKPSNILIDVQDQPQVADFGLARQLEGDSELTVTGQVLGSPQYLPPEQATGQRARVSRPTDVYALGATLYHLLTGRPPFQAESLAQTLDQVLHADPVTPRLLNPRVPVDLETICLKCLEKEPSRRYATAQEVADELGRFLSGEPILARPLGPAGQLAKWCRRNPRLAATSAVAAASVVVGLTGVAWQWRQAEAQRARAEGSELSLQHRTYIAEINAAQFALRDHNPGRALELLYRHRPDVTSDVRRPTSEITLAPRRSPLAPDLRGWEWRYLWQQCQSEAEAPIDKLPGPIHSLEVSPDGQWLFAGSIGGEPRLWHLATAEPVRVAGEADWAFGAFSPDSRWLVLCAETTRLFGRVLVWDLVGRRRLEPIYDQRRVATMAFSPDGRWFGYGVHQPPSGRRIVVLDFATRQQVREIIALAPLEGWQVGMDWVFTRDSRSVIFAETEGYQDRWIGLCDVAATSEPQYFPGHGAPITALALSPDGQMLATGAGYTDTTDTSIKLWEVPSFRPLGELTNHQSWITALSFSPDGRRLASAGADQTWRLWDVPMRTQRQVFGGLSSDVLRLRFSPDGEKLFAGSSDGTVHRWSPTTPPAERQPSVWRKPAGLESLVLAPDARIYAALRHGEVCWGEVAGEPAPSRLQELGTNNTHLLFSSDGQSLFAGTQTGEVQVWSLPRRQLLRRLRGTVEPVVLLRQDPQGRVLVTVQSTAAFEVERPYPPSRISVWDTAEWRQQNSWVVQGVSRKLVATDGRWLAMNWTARAIQVWSLSDLSRTNRLSFPGEILGLAFSLDGQLLAAANLTGTVKIWDVPHFREHKEFKPHSRPVSTLAFSPDTRRLATAGDGDEAVKLWDVATRQELIRLPHDRLRLQELLFSADGNQILARTSSGDLLFWHAPSLAEIAQAEDRRAAAQQPARR